MHGYSSQAQISKIQSRQNGVILEDYIDFNSYNIWMPAGRQWFTTAGTETIAVNQGVPVQIFPDAVTTTINQSVRRPRSWVGGMVSAHIWYTGDAVVGTNVTMGLRLDLFKQNAVMALGAITPATFPAPSVTSQLYIYRGFAQSVGATSYVDIGNDYDLISVALRRSGAGEFDTYTDDFQFIGLELIYKESKHHTVGGKVDVDKRYEATAS